MKDPAAIESRLRTIEKMIGEIYVEVCMSKRIEGVDELAYRRAIEAAVTGDLRALDHYVKCGGKIPVRAEGDKSGRAS